MTGSSVYLKCTAAGLVAVIVAIGIFFVVEIISVIIMSRRSSGDTVIGWDPISFARDPLPWIVLTLIFVTGFWWKYHQLTQR
jgi:hypothetical protein